MRIGKRQIETSALVVFLIAGAATIKLGGEKVTNRVGQVSLPGQIDGTTLGGMSSLEPFLHGNGLRSGETWSVTPEDVTNGYRLVSETVAGAIAEPTAAAITNWLWTKRGAYEDAFTIQTTNWTFRIPSGAASNLLVFATGRMTMRGHEELVLPRAFDEDVAILPMSRWNRIQDGASASAFWHEVTPSNTLVVTWVNALLGRNIASNATFQAEFYPNGEFEYRHADETRRYCVLNAFDWDGDGLANPIDPDPYTSSGDCFGTGEGWLAANPAVVAATNENPSAYYLLEFTSLCDNTLVQITCDGPSNLGDMLVVAHSNQVCRVPLLMGAGYEVAASHSIGAVSLSDAHAELQLADGSQIAMPGPFVGGTPCACYSVSYPLSISAWDNLNGTATLSLLPPIPGLEFLSVGGGCCSNAICGASFEWGCSGTCGCQGGLHALTATAAWEGYTNQLSWSSWCPCVHGAEPEGALPRLVLDAPRTLFTNGNGGAEGSDIVPVTAGLLSQGPTNGTLTLGFTGGDVGVNVWDSSNRTNRLSLPIDLDVAQTPGKTFYVEGAFPISRGANGFSLEWTDPSNTALLSTNTSLAVYCPIVNVVNSSIYDNGDLCNPAGIVVGTNACFAVGFSMVTPPASEIAWSVVQGSASIDGPRFGERVRVSSTVPGQKVTLRAQVDDCRSRPIEISAHVVTQEVVKLTVWIVGNDSGTYYASNPAVVSNMVAGVNKIYEQIGMSFFVDSISYTNNNQWLDLCDPHNKCDSVRRRELVDLTKNSGGLEIYLIDRVAPGVRANHDRYGIVMSTNATAKSLAHEIGHSFGSADVYPFRRVGTPAALPEPMVSEGHLPADWSNGTGCRYYMPNLTQETAIRRLLMCGLDYPTAIDLSSGPIYGYRKKSPDAGLVDAGFFNSSGRALIILHW